MPVEGRSEDVCHFIQVVQVLASDGLRNLLLRVHEPPLTNVLPVRQQFGSQVLLQLHLAEIVIVLVLEMVFWEQPNRVLILPWLHGDDVVVLLLLLEHLSVRNEAVQAFQGTTAHI